MPRRSRMIQTSEGSLLATRVNRERLYVVRFFLRTPHHPTPDDSNTQEWHRYALAVTSLASLRVEIARILRREYPDGQGGSVAEILDLQWCD